MGDHSRLGRSARHWIHAHADDLAEIPPPTETWTARDVSFEHGWYQKMRTRGVIERVGESSDPRERTIWRTNQAAYELIKQLTEESK